MLNSIATAQPLRIYFGDLKKLPYAWDASASECITFNEAIFARLIKVDSDFRLQPGLLQQYYFDQKLNGYVLVLADGLKFSNGRKVTSKDLEFSLLRGFFSKRPNFYRVYFSNIDGIKNVRPGSTFRSGAVSGVRILDEQRLLVKLNANNPSFLYSLSNLLLRLVPHEELQNDLFSWKKYPIGAGDYVVKSVDTKRFAIRIQSKEQREFEMIFALPDSPPDISLVEYDGFASRRFDRPIAVAVAVFSNSTPLAKDSSFRKSFSAAVVKNLKHPTLEPAYELLPPALWGRISHNKTSKRIQTYEGKTVKGQILNLASKPNVIKRAMFESFEQTIKLIGAIPNVSYTQNKFLDSQTESKSEIYGFSILADYFDPLIMFNAFSSISPLKTVRLTNDEKFQKLYTVAENADNSEARVSSIKALSEYILEKSYVIPLYYEYPVVYFNPKVVSAIGATNTPNLLHLSEIKATR